MLFKVACLIVLVLLAVKLARFVSGAVISAAKFLAACTFLYWFALHVVRPILSGY